MAERKEASTQRTCVSIAAEKYQRVMSISEENGRQSNLDLPYVMREKN
jgi:hypothetical protein